MKSNTINMKIKPTTLIRVDNNDNHYEQHNVGKVYFKDLLLSKAIRRKVKIERFR